MHPRGFYILYAAPRRAVVVAGSFTAQSYKTHGITFCVATQAEGSTIRDIAIRVGLALSAGGLGSAVLANCNACYACAAGGCCGGNGNSKHENGKK